MFMGDCYYCRRPEGQHDHRCPNYIPSELCCRCNICGDVIYTGEEYCENLDGEVAHYDCLTDLSIREMLEWAGCNVGSMEDGEL
jgi:hypothetical protein